MPETKEKKRERLHAPVKEAIAQREEEKASEPAQLADSPHYTGEPVEIVGKADAPTASQNFNFQGAHAHAYGQPYVAPKESVHAGRTIQPVKIECGEQVIGVPVERLRSRIPSRRGGGRSRVGAISGAARALWDKISWKKN